MTCIYLHAGGMTDLFRHESMVICVKFIATSRKQPYFKDVGGICWASYLVAKTSLPKLWPTQLGYFPKGTHTFRWIVGESTSV